MTKKTPNIKIKLEEDTTLKEILTTIRTKGTIARTHCEAYNEMIAKIDEYLEYLN